MVLLYCYVNSTSPNLIVTWTKDGDTLFNDLPHIHIQSSPFGVFLLTMVNFQPSDGGSYQCSAQEGVNTAIGPIASLTGTRYYSQKQVDNTHLWLSPLHGLLKQYRAMKEA